MSFLVQFRFVDYDKPVPHSFATATESKGKCWRVLEGRAAYRSIAPHSAPDWSEWMAIPSFDGDKL